MHLTDKGVIKGRGYVISEQPFVIAVGGANVDIHARPDVAATPADSNPGVVRSSPGGVARNVAENLARLDVDCRLISAVGNDRSGETLLQHCRNAGINVDKVYRTGAEATSSYVSILDEDGDLSVAINDMRIMDHLRPEELQSCEAMLKQSALIVLDTNLTADAIGWLAGILPGKPIFADTVSAAKAPRLRDSIGAIHTLKTNPREAEALTGIAASDAAGRGAVARRLHELGVQRVFVSLGEGGLFYSTMDARGTVRSSAGRDEIRNSAGAGDALLAGIAYAWLEDEPLEETIEFGLAMAAMTVGNEQSSNPELSLTAVREVLARRHAG